MAQASLLSAVIEIQDTKHFDSIISKYKKVIVDFGATWCQPCRKIAPFFHQVAETNQTQDTVFISVDVDLCEVSVFNCHFFLTY